MSAVLGVGKGGKGSVHDAVTCFKPPAGKLSAVAFFGLERLGSPAAFDWQANWCSKLHWLDPAVLGVRGLRLQPHETITHEPSGSCEL